MMRPSPHVGQRSPTPSWGASPGGSASGGGLGGLGGLAAEVVLVRVLAALVLGAFGVSLPSAAFLDRRARLGAGSAGSCSVAEGLCVGAGLGAGLGAGSGSSGAGS